MRFQVSQVMDAIEQRLTTDVTGAQAVVDLGEIVRNVALDRGRPVSLVRIGMVLDALGRYLVDGGAMLYGVVERGLLSEQAFTSKERMVLGRWADDGLIEVASVIGDRVVEIADLTGLPLILARQYPELMDRYGWLADDRGRVLRLTHRGGVAVLSPAPGSDPGAGDTATAAEPAIGRATVPQPAEAEAGEQPEADEHSEAGEKAEADEQPEAEEKAATDEQPEAGAGAEQPPEQERPEQERPAEKPAEEPDPLPLPVVAFANRGAASVTRTRMSRHRFLRAEPNPGQAALLRRQWRCDAFECPVFGEHRRIGQPVPRLRGDVPVCPRHDQPVTDAGPRLPSYAVSIVVDDLPRQRLVVRAGHPVSVGRAVETAAGVDDPAVVSVTPWLHRAATVWISPVHLRLEASDQGLVVTDLSDNGSVVWQRKGPDDPGTTKPLYHESHTLGEWDGVELYTGIGLVRADRRLAAVLGRDEPTSVLLDAPTAAHHQVDPGQR